MMVRKQGLEGSISTQQHTFTIIVHTHPQVVEQDNGYTSYFRTWVLSSMHYFATKTMGVKFGEEFYAVIAD